MGFLDFIIILVLILGFIKGYTVGMVRQAFAFVGLVFVIVLAFIFKNYLSVIFYENLPFLSIGGIFKGIEAINILVYEFLAFFVVLGVLMIALKIALFASGIIDKIISCTLIITMPARIIGGIIGVLEAFVYTFIVLLIVNLPSVTNDFFRDNLTMDEFILTKTPFLSTLGTSLVDTSNEILTIKDKYADIDDSNQVNLEVIELLLKNKIVTSDSIEVLIEKGKLNIDGLEELIRFY